MPLGSDGPCEMLNTFAASKQARDKDVILIYNVKVAEDPSAHPLNLAIRKNIYNCLGWCANTVTMRVV